MDNEKLSLHWINQCKLVTVYMHRVWNLTPGVELRKYRNSVTKEIVIKAFLHVHHQINKKVNINAWLCNIKEEMKCKIKAIEIIKNRRGL